MKDVVIEPGLDLETDDAPALEVPDDLGDANEPTVYEVGYHLIPTVGDVGLQEAVTTVTDVLKKLDAEFVAEKLPAKFDLAYTLEKKIEGATRRFDTSYFGWVAFALGASRIHEVKDSLDQNPSILRSLIVKTSRDAVALNLAEPVVDISTAVKREAEVGGEVSEAALDTALKQIEEEDVKTEEKS